MKKILYVVSTLRSSGPTNQLFNLVRHMDRNEYDIHILSLSPEPGDSRFGDFVSIGVQVHTLGLSRLAGALLGGKRLREFVIELKPDVVHSHGFRPDLLLANTQVPCPWVTTLHNYPLEDYLMKFGRLKGSIMAVKHLRAIKACSLRVACSYSIAEKFTKHSIITRTIQNGVEPPKGLSRAFGESEYERPIFVSVGSLIKRKNMKLLLNAFNIYKKTNKGSLLILGDGPELESLKAGSGPSVYLMGSVSNVPDYLAASDYFVSCSLSEGLPNTVLEAFAVGLPVILSNIPSHLEIKEAAGSACEVFPLEGGVVLLAEILGDADSRFPADARANTTSLISQVFSAEIMSQNYQRVYRDAITES
jgi:glycosyltransferase involved in cell wall biosynthesis